MTDTSKAKDTIYVDVDDEITTVIDKVVASKHNIIALVLPKRASVFQSIVNMKLLKRKADDASKNLVLITTESSLLPLAGAVGLYAAKTLASKPEIPPSPDVADSLVDANEDDPISLDDDEEKPDIDLKAAAGVAVGALAADEAISKKPDKDMETIELDNAAEDNKGGDSKAEGAKKPAKSAAKKDKKLRVPNFERFRLLLVLGGLAIIIIIALIWASVSVFPKATIDIQTDAANVNVSVPFTMSTTATTLNTSTETVPAKNVTETKTYTGTANATGQQNNGQKATGNVSMSAEECNTFASPSDVPAGTGISQNGNTYITQSDVSFNVSSPNKKGNCLNYTANNSTAISAQQAGSASNSGSSSTTFSVPGRSDVTATGSASGGTDDNVQVVSQSDITSAQNKITTNTAGAKQDLTNQLNQSNLSPISETFVAAAPTVTPNASAGTAASSVTVTETIAYSMYGVHNSNLQTLVNNNIIAQVSSNQSILDNGLSNATYSNTNGPGDPTHLTVQTTAEVGPNINVQLIKQQAVGKKSSDIQGLVKNTPHVTSVSVHFSPFYVDTAPSKLSKITVNIAKPTTKTGSNASSQ